MRSSAYSSTPDTAALSVLVEARLDQLEVPVAQLRPERVVELERGVREAEAVVRARSRSRSAAPAARRSSGPRPSLAAAGSGSTSDTRSRISREAFQSLLARSRPCLTRSSLKRTSCVEDIASRPKRSASAPCSSIRSSGSMPVPSDFDIRRPSGAWITEWMFTSVNGISPVNSIAEHHHAGHPEEDDVARRGEHVGRVEGAQLRRLLGPAERGERPQRRTRTRCRARRGRAPSPRPRAARCRRSVSSPRYQTGSWWPHQSWREMHQGRMFSSQSR